jgi:hypothetical protein
VVLHRLIPIVHAKKVSMKPPLRDNIIKDPPLPGRQDFLVSRVAKKVSVVTTVSRVISKVLGVEKGDNRGAVLVGVQEEEVFELRLKELDFGLNKLAKVGHA